MVILPDPDSPFSRSKSYFANYELILHIDFEGGPPTNLGFASQLLESEANFCQKAAANLAFFLQQQWF